MWRKFFDRCCPGPNLCRLRLSLIIRTLAWCKNHDGSTLRWFCFRMFLLNDLWLRTGRARIRSG